MVRKEEKAGLALMISLEIQINFVEHLTTEQCHAWNFLLHQIYNLGRIFKKWSKNKRKILRKVPFDCFITYVYNQKYSNSSYSVQQTGNNRRPSAFNLNLLTTVIKVINDLWNLREVRLWRPDVVSGLNSAS